MLPDYLKNFDILSTRAASSTNDGVFVLLIFEWSLVYRVLARIGAVLPSGVYKDKEARSANGNALRLGTKRARPIAISSGGPFFLTRL